MEVHTLNRKSVYQTVARRTIGTYFLGHFEPDGTFVVRYIGRSLTCLQERLLHHASMTSYAAFKFHPWNSVIETYQMECLYYHHYLDQIDNKRHPDSPRHIAMDCRYCKTAPLSRQAKIEADAEKLGVA